MPNITLNITKDNETAQKTLKPFECILISYKYIAFHAISWFFTRFLFDLIDVHLFSYTINTFHAITVFFMVCFIISLFITLNIYLYFMKMHEISRKTIEHYKKHQNTPNNIERHQLPPNPIKTH